MVIFGFIALRRSLLSGLRPRNLTGKPLPCLSAFLVLLWGWTFQCGGCEPVFPLGLKYVFVTDSSGCQSIPSSTFLISHMALFKQQALAFSLKSAFVGKIKNVDTQHTGYVSYIVCVVKLFVKHTHIWEFLGKTLDALSLLHN